MEISLDLKEIVTAWSSKISPTEDQKRLAEKRMSVCNSCEFPKELIEGQENSRYCTKCGCILTAKVYSYKESACPEGKWADIDKDYRNTKAIKVLKNPNSPLV